jgi:hypothetical protein
MRLLAATLRMDRFELRAIAVLGGVIFLGSALFAARLLSFGIPDACFADELSSACQPWAGQLFAYHATVDKGMQAVIIALILLPIVGGLLVGTSLVGKEIDERTTTFAWSIAPDRRRWLLLRVVPPAVFLVLVALAIGLFDDWVMWLASHQPQSVLGFDLLGLRGIVPAGAALSTFGISLFVGAVMGRVLPTLLIAGGFIAAAYLGVSFVSGRFLENETIVVAVATAPPGLQLDSFFQTPEGELISWDEAFGRYGPDMNLWTVTLEPFERMNVYETYPQVAARIAILHGGLGLAAITLAFAVVSRRRP